MSFGAMGRLRHRDICVQRIDSIGDWLLGIEELKAHNGSREDRTSHATLFCHGNPGEGKNYIT